MNITIRLTKVENETPKELQKREKSYQKSLEEKVRSDLRMCVNMLVLVIFPRR